LPLQQRKVLIFAQQARTLDAVQAGVLDAFFPDIATARIDGSVAPSHRIEVARSFNSDPFLLVLLLTTAIGGLGLSLTGADTVIFIDHDWNPFRDLQAMDRAHRLGQRRAVSVYRLLARGTLEERVMSAQRFKLAVADAAVGSAASGLPSAASPPPASSSLGPPTEVDALGGRGGELDYDPSSLLNLLRAPQQPNSGECDSESRFEAEAEAAQVEELDLSAFLELIGGNAEPPAQ